MFRTVLKQNQQKSVKYIAVKAEQKGKYSGYK